MLTDLAYKRKERVKSQFDYITAEAADLGFDSHPAFAPIISDAEGKIAKAETRQDRLTELDDQGATEEQVKRVYPRLLSVLGFAQFRINDAQQALLYLTTNQQQQQSYSDRFAYTESVCDEIIELFTFDIEYLPVIWDGYAAFAITRGDFYAIHLPRDEDQIRGSPILAHELGHCLFDNLSHTAKQEFRNRLEQVCREFVDRKRPIVRSAWRMWFTELICDACGALTFGPVYLSVLTERLCTGNPFTLPSDVSEVGHPPDALRYQLVNDILEERLPPEVYEVAEQHCQRYENHLSLVRDDPPASYDGWIDDELIDLVITAAEDKITSDLQTLAEATLDESPPEEFPAQQERIKANREILGL